MAEKPPRQRPTIRIEVPEGRVDDADYLTTGERAICDYLADRLSDARLRLVVRELLQIEAVRIEVLEALTEDE
jgi:hypothetical protein